jgi:hypothetical protein
METLRLMVFKANLLQSSKGDLKKTPIPYLWRTKNGRVDQVSNGVIGFDLIRCDSEGGDSKAFVSPTDPDVLDPRIRRSVTP